MDVTESYPWLKELRAALAWIVPLSITSPDIITSLPSVLAAITFLVLLLAASPLIPVSLMFEDATRGPDGRLRILSRNNDQPVWNTVRWFFAFFLPGILIAIGVFANAFWWPDTKWPIKCAATLAALVFSGMVR